MRAALYCRLSDEDRNKRHPGDDSASIQNQKAMLIRFAEQNGWQIFDIYSDDDYSGADRDRPGFNRLIDDAKQRKFDIVLCKTQSRFTRELELVEKYIHGLFPILGIRFVSLTDHGDTENKGNRKSRQINGLVNEWFLEDLSENLRSVLTSKRRLGQHIGPFAPYGYRKDPDQKGHLLIDPEAAEVVRTIFRLYAEGSGKKSIARRLNSEGIPNPTAYRQRKKVTQQTALWGRSTIGEMLTNRVYIGDLVQGKAAVISYKTGKKRTLPPDQWIIVRGTHEPIIDKSLWDQVQDLSARRAIRSGNAEEGIFSRKVRCGLCGYHLRSVKKGEKRGFTCRTHALSPDACPGVWISQPKLEGIVAAQISALSEELLDMEALAEGIKASDQKEDIHMLQQKSTRIQTELRRLYLDKVQGILSESDYLSLSDDLRQQKLQLDEQTISEPYVSVRKLDREMVRFLIDQIFVGKRDPESGITPVEIHWNF